MTKYVSGMDALDELNREEESSEKTGGEFFKLQKGSPIKVRVMSLGDLITYIGYNHFKKGVHTFTAEEPPVYTDKGYPKSNLTPWDKAFNYYSDMAFKEKDKAKQDKIREVGRQFLGKKRFVVGFINLEDGEPIVIDMTKPQAQSMYTPIQKNEKKLDKKAFEIEKTGEGTKTTIISNPLDLDDLSEEELKNFHAHDGKEFDHSLFEGLLYEADEKEMLESLARVGFDLKLIDESLSSVDDEAPPKGESTDDNEDDDLPF